MDIVCALKAGVPPLGVLPLGEPLGLRRSGQREDMGGARRGLDRGATVRRHTIPGSERVLMV
eukprot:358234-Chlamydomonas_euryale.AAC.5